MRLIERIRAGDESAKSELVARYFDAFYRWARGRLPHYARAEKNTEDLVQDTVIRALNRIEAFEPREAGSFLAYLRQILKNLIRDEIRKAQRRPRTEEVDESIEDEAPGPVEQAIGSETLARYEAALARLPAQQKEGVIMRLELQFTYQQIADQLGMPSANAARMMISRSLVKLAELMENSIATR